MSAATQQAPTPRRRSIIPRTRRGRVVAVLAALVAVPSLAFALYLIGLNITGSVTVNTLAVEWDGQDGPAIDDGLDCTASTTPDGQSTNVSASGFPSSSCTILLNARADDFNSEAVRLVGVTEPAGMPAGVSVDLKSGLCGTTLASGASGDAHIVVSTDATATGGTLPAGLRLEFVPASEYTAALCTP